MHYSTVGGTLRVSLWIGATSITVAAIWLIGLVVHIEVIRIIQYMPIAECKDVTTVVVVVLPWIGFVGYMDDIV
jgi:hypothetical protein